MMRLNLGCGTDRRAGWLNVDCRAVCEEGPEFLRCDLAELDEHIPDLAVHEIAACDVLEHVPWREVDPLMAMLVRKLVPGGQLFIQAPDLDHIARDYLAGRLSHLAAQRYLFGDQGYPENTHGNVWSAAEMRHRMETVGLIVENIEHINYNVRGWGRRQP